VLTLRSLGHGELEDNAEEDSEGDDAENDPDDDKVSRAAAETALFLRRWGRRFVAGGALPHWKFTWGPILAKDHPMMVRHRRSMVLMVGLSQRGHACVK